MGSERDRRDRAFAELFGGRAVALRRVAYLLCGDWHRAEDLTQTAFAKVYAAWPRLVDLGTAEDYLRRTLVNAFLDEQRRAWRRERATAELPELPHHDHRSTDDRLLLVAALGAVPPRQRACLVLRFFEDCSVERTAALLGCSTGTVKSNTARGLDSLRRALDGALDDHVTP
ncbi:SigE family RNA polymerase sigma factor [Vallicoccus soli]|uniref:SigE family RNA polymerase sigma factor n=1 Tax=Vallicoccus soli TaxID=2339232 RepID=A0A3A3Z0H2_9ACTN|nr:SigE family RNA polymerase sigma factor [Vallicoccus soli]RJK97749.1 SigE family RNA polymerase sigma factor [Vallicoccus soli]